MYFEGTGSVIGEACGSAEQCAEWLANASWASGASASPQSYPDYMDASGVLSGDKCENPAYHDYSAVYVPLCTADAYAADRAASAQTGGVHLRGERVMKAILNNIISKKSAKNWSSPELALAQLAYSFTQRGLSVASRRQIVAIIGSFWDVSQSVRATGEELRTFYNIGSSHVCAKSHRLAHLLPFLFLHRCIGRYTSSGNADA